ncbi:MAG: hypothetical protein RR497_04945 [Oscillospiraceae bacterium]
MNDKELINLQRYIGKRSKGESDSDVISHIVKLNSSHEITQDEWGKLLFIACANCDITILEYILSKLMTLNNPNDYIKHTLGFRNVAVGYEEKQVMVIKRLFSYVLPQERNQVLNDALVQAVWFGEYESVKYLLDQGADLSYQSNGRSMIELAQNAVIKFNDHRVEKLILLNG